MPVGNIELLFDEEATWKSLESKIEALGSRSGFTVLYFSGHGSFDVINPRSQEAFLAPYDWDPEDASSLLSVDWLLGEVEPGSGDTSLVILDACFTGGEGRSVEYAAKPAVMAKLPTEHKSIVLASSEGSQISLENEYTRHGMFTYYLLSGLKGNAPADGGWIYLDDLYDYVREQVETATSNRQTPVLKGEGEKIKLGRSR
ncbi:CHAT domain-containing protein [candidate division WOR-3 bacterium]|nr:CHAT domain-containing protein [candidate division WOR-3 bacterium]